MYIGKKSRATKLILQRYTAKFEIKDNATTVAIVKISNQNVLVALIMTIHCVVSSV